MTEQNNSTKPDRTSEETQPQSVEDLIAKWSLNIYRSTKPAYRSLISFLKEMGFIPLIPPTSGEPSTAYQNSKETSATTSPREEPPTSKPRPASNQGSEESETPYSSPSDAISSTASSTESPEEDEKGKEIHDQKHIRMPNVEPRSLEKPDGDKPTRTTSSTKRVVLSAQPTDDTSIPSSPPNTQHTNGEDIMENGSDTPPPVVTQKPDTMPPPIKSRSREPMNVNNLGYYLDGWAELVEGMGEKVDEVRANVLKGLKERNMPDIQIAEKTAIVGMISSEKRDYSITTTSPGATTTIFVGKHGEDLYTSWRTFQQLVINLQTLLIILGISAALGFFTGGMREGNAFLGIERGFSFNGWITTTIAFTIFISLIVAIAGRVMKGNFLAYFFIETNIFDAEDITAMCMSVHKTLLRALDTSGIDVSKLRVKQEFQGGRRGEKV